MKTITSVNSTIGGMPKSVDELLAACKEMVAKRPKPVVYAISRPLFNELPEESQKLYLQFGNHVIEIPERVAFDVTGIVDRAKNPPVWTTPNTGG